MSTTRQRELAAVAQRRREKPPEKLLSVNEMPFGSRSPESHPSTCGAGVTATSPNLMNRIFYEINYYTDVKWSR